jgi:catechol 2,3-dioxygenase-like lactoylglutathione lyase family enzyme
MIDPDQKEPTMPDAGNLESGQASRAGAIQVAGLDHLVLRVADLDRAIKFYGEVLGCHVERRLDEPKLVQLRAGASMIDLVPAGPAPQSAQAVAGRNLDHFAVRISTFDFPALAAHLQQHGIAAGEVRRRYGAEGYGSSLYITDPDGNVVELKGPPEQAE